MEVVHHLEWVTLDEILDCKDKLLFEDLLVVLNQFFVRRVVVSLMEVGIRLPLCSHEALERRVDVAECRNSLGLVAAPVAPLMELI